MASGRGLVGREAASTMGCKLDVIVIFLLDRTCNRLIKAGQMRIQKRAGLSDSSRSTLTKRGSKLVLLTGSWLMMIFLKSALALSLSLNNK